MNRLVEAWILSSHETAESPLKFHLAEITIPSLQRGEIEVEPLYGCWEGNMGHALIGKPINICLQRKEPHVVLGNSGVVRVVDVGDGVDSVQVGDVCAFFGGGKLDRFGYMELAHAYDLPKSIGLLAKRSVCKEHNLLRIPKNSAYSLAQWAAFSLRYVTAWANWRIAFGCYRLQVPQEQLAIPHVWGWGGGTSLAELELARRAGCKAVLVTGSQYNAEKARALGISVIEKNEYADLFTSNDSHKNDSRSQRALRSAERAWRNVAREVTDGLGVSIFIDYIGEGTWGPTLRVMGRNSVITTAGWKTGFDLQYNRASASVRRVQFIHTHYASRTEGEDAVAFGEETGWMPVVDSVWKWEQVGMLASEFAKGTLQTYFPVFEVNAS